MTGSDSLTAEEYATARREGSLARDAGRTALDNPYGQSGLTPVEVARGVQPSPRSLALARLWLMGWRQGRSAPVELPEI